MKIIPNVDKFIESINQNIWETKANPPGYVVYYHTLKSLIDAMTVDVEDSSIVIKLSATSDNNQSSDVVNKPVEGDAIVNNTVQTQEAFTDTEPVSSNDINERNE